MLGSFHLSSKNFIQQVVSNSPLIMDQQNDKSKEFMVYLFSSDSFKDVTLVCDDLKQIKAHRNVLSFYSPFFLKLFSVGDDTVLNNMVIFLKGIKYQHMEMILRYLYLGEVEVNEKHTTELLSATKTLELDGFNHLDKISNTTPDYSVEAKNKTEDLEKYPNTAMNLEEGLGMSTVVTIQNVQKCPHCYKVYSAERNLRNHIKSDHKESFDKSMVKKEPIEASSKLTKPLKKKVKLERDNKDKQDHLESVHGPKDIQCNLCEKSFSAQKSLNYHMDYSHNKLASFVCDECGNKYKAKGLLDSHIANVHKGIRHHCTYKSCNFVCVAKGYLVKHIKTVHEGLRLKCDQCDYEAKCKQ